MKKNILLFMNAFSNKNDLIGMSGGDQMFIQIFKRILKDFNLTFIYTNMNGEKCYRQELNSAKYLLSPRFMDNFNLFITYFLRTFSGLSCIKLNNIDVVYSGSDVFSDVIPSFFYKLFHKKVRWCQCVFHIYPDWKTRPGSKIRNFIGQYMQKFSLFFIKRYADCIITINHDVYDYLISKGFDKSKIFINTPGIDWEYISQINIKYNEQKIYDSVFLARIHPSKGIFDLIEIWKKTIKIKPNAKLVLIGTGETQFIKELKELIIKNDLSNNIELFGFLETEEAFRIIKKGKVFVFPSHEEGFGIVIAEAMALKIPVITWDLHVYTELFENYISQIQENNFSAFSEKIIEFIQNETQTNEISAAAHLFVKKYSWENISQKHLEILSK